MYAQEEINRTTPLHARTSGDTDSDSSVDEDEVNKWAASFTLRGWRIRLVSFGEYDALVSAAT